MKNYPCSVHRGFKTAASSWSNSTVVLVCWKKNCLTNHQSGNKRYHSTETLGLLVADHLFNTIDKKKITAMLLIDLSKAFDSICHSTLLKKLQMLGTSPNALNYFKSYLANREQSTRIESTVATSLIVIHGVPQGSILGSLLFNIYMHEMPEVVENSLAESFVDDSKIFLSFSINEIEKALSLISCDLRKVAEWCCANYLLINPDKTKFIIFGTRQLLARLGDVTIPFLDKDLSPLPSCMDPGVIFDRHLSFNEHIDYLSSSLQGKLCQISRVRHLFTKDVLSVILNSLVFSKLFYYSTVRSGTSQQNICRLQLLQNFAARILTGKKKYDHISESIKHLGWLPINEMLQFRDVTMVYKCLNGLAPNYLQSKLVKRCMIHRYNTRRRNDICIPIKRTLTAQKSFFDHAISLWNTLSEKTKNCTNVITFKRSSRKELWSRL